MTGAPGSTFEFEGSQVPLRFERLWRLVGATGLQRLHRTHVVVIGLGGVGSFAAEALARSGIGRLTLVDFDRICPTNINRQLHALESSLGRPKAQHLATRLADINPNAHIVPLVLRCEAQTMPRILGPNGVRPDWVADCIDQVDSKVQLIAACHREGIPLVTSLGAASRWDPTLVRVADLGRTHTDPLGKIVRKRLRTLHHIPTTSPTGIPAVFSLERPTPPWIPETLRMVGMEHAGPEPPPHPRKQVLGSAVFVTSVFGMTVASVIVRKVLETAQGQDRDQTAAPSR